MWFLLEVWVFVCSQLWQGLVASVQNGEEGTCLRPDPHEFRTISTEFGEFRWQLQRILGFGTLKYSISKKPGTAKVRAQLQAWVAHILFNGFEIV